MACAVGWTFSFQLASASVVNTVLQLSSLLHARLSV